LQEALTDFITLARWSLPIPVDRYPSTRVALVQAEPHTGRRHQIRRHLKHVAHPIIGDANHGKGAHNRWWAHHLGMQRLWLHAASLSLTHPVHQQLMHWRSPVTDEPLNADWSALLARGDWQWLASHTPASLQAL
jgi:tRNA pseudouridine65 synthase